MKMKNVKLTKEEKIRLVTGKGEWNVNDLDGKLSSVRFSDGPHGLNMIDENGNRKKATIMPSLVVLANTWNLQLARLQGETIADECIENGTDVLLAPGVNIKRTPLNGRNFEYFSEDPYLSGVMGREYINGVQSRGVGACLKHYCANNLEFERYYQSSEVDERTLREIYLKPFEIALEAQPWTVMCSYNLVNGVYVSENQWLLTDILRDGFGFSGTVVSDWGAVHSPYRSVMAGVDLAMPEAVVYEAEKKDFEIHDLNAALEKGLLEEEALERAAGNVVRLTEKVAAADKQVRFSKEQRHENAVSIAKEGIVLLKNDGILPLKAGKYCIGGTCAVKPVSGNGSAYVAGDYAQRPLHELFRESGKAIEGKSFELWGKPSSSHDYKLLAEEAYSADGIILCVHGYKEGESFDRSSIAIRHRQEEYILRLTELYDNVIVCVYEGSAVDMSPWIDRVRAVVFVGYAGEGTNEALCSVLVGDTVPSGKLSETFPCSLADAEAPLGHGNGFVIPYREGQFVGYRYYDTFRKDVLFPFGFGLSYAKFEYSDLAVVKRGETEYEISYTIENTSDLDAKEISQVYVRDVFAMVERPEQELKAFSKDFIRAHEKKRVRILLSADAFAYYSIPLKKWYIENGDFEIRVGASSRDIRLNQSIRVELPKETQVSQS